MFYFFVEKNNVYSTLADFKIAVRNLFTPFYRSIIVVFLANCIASKSLYSHTFASTVHLQFYRDIEFQPVFKQNCWTLHGWTIKNVYIRASKRWEDTLAWILRRHILSILGNVLNKLGTKHGVMHLIWLDHTGGSQNFYPVVTGIVVPVCWDWCL